MCNNKRLHDMIKIFCRIKGYKWLCFLALFLILPSCNYKKSNNLQSQIKTSALDSVLAETNTENKRTIDSLVLVNECKNEWYSATLEEFFNRQKDAFRLKITLKNGQIKTEILNLRPGFAKIRKCSKKYVVVGMPCGGPCYGGDFVFINKEKLREVYMYYNIATSNENIISHIENEEFKKLKIKNLSNDREIVIELSEKESPMTFLDLDSINVVGSELYMFSQYGKTKNVNIEAILDK